MCHLCHWSVNVTCGGQCHLRLFGWPVFCTVIAEYLVFLVIFRWTCCQEMVALCAICAIGQSVSLVVVSVICIFLASLYVAHLLQNI